MSNISERHNKKSMTYKEFMKWPGMNRGVFMTKSQALMCLNALDALYSAPFWKRKKVWAKLNEKNIIVNTVIRPVEARLEKERNYEGTAACQKD